MDICSKVSAEIKSGCFPSVRPLCKTTNNMKVSTFFGVISTLPEAKFIHSQHQMKKWSFSSTAGPGALEVFFDLSWLA